MQRRDIQGVQRRRIGLCGRRRRRAWEFDGLEIRLEGLLQFDARLLRALSAQQ